MEQLIARITEELPLFLLILLRVSGLFIISPIFGRRNVPAVFKIGFAFMLSIILIQTLSGENGMTTTTDNAWAYGLLCIKELLIGWIMGYVMTLFFSAVYTAGQLLDIQIGFGMMNILDPQNEMQVPLMGNLLNLLALLVFFALDGHHTLIKMLVGTFRVIPPGTVNIRSGISKEVVSIFTSTFLMAVKIAIPITAAMVLSEAALGIMVRAVPQMNIFVVGIPLKILIGLLALLLFLPIYVQSLGGVFDDMYNAAEKLLQGMVP